MSNTGLGFEKVVATCPVRRLGSLMDFSPVIDGMSRFFPGRGVLVPMSREADCLWRYKFADMVQKGEAIDLRSASPEKIRDQLERQRVLALPFADDMGNGDETLVQLFNITPADACWIGSDELRLSLYRFGPSLSDGRRLRHTNSLDHAIETKWGRGPFILKGAIAAVEKAMELEGRALPSDFALSPRVWTSSKEVEVAERFFAARGLEPARTIGIHLTAATYDVDLRIWRWESFFELAAHFLANGYQVLLITGALSLPIPTPLESESWRFHQDFLDRFRFSDLPHREEAALFYGDALAEAEVIRRCAVFLSAETGPAHLASAIGTPKVTIASSDLHQAAWMLTGPNDFGFVTEKDQQRRIVGPTEEEVIGAVETLLQRRAANALACG